MTDEIKCPVCDANTKLRTSKKDNRTYHVCVNYPECKGKVLVSPSIKPITVPRNMSSQKPAQSYEGPPMVEAIKHAKERGAQIATKYELTLDSANRVAQIVSDGIKNKSGIEGLVRAIRKEFPDMTISRARFIAQYETSEALSFANLKRSKAMGVTGKEWIVCDDDKLCDICRANAAEGAVPIDHVFSSGDMRPTQHEGCRCCLVPVMLPDEK